MAFYPNPGYGYIPGAPQGVHRWIGNQFALSGLPPVPPPPPLPPVTTAATPTPQDVATQQGAGMLAPRVAVGGADPGGGGPGGGPGGIGPGAYPGQPNPGMGGGVGAPGGDQTFSGYPGVYAQAPGEMDSRFGEGLGYAGVLGGSIGGIPGVGTVAGALGGAIDAARYNGINAQYGVPGRVDPWGSAASAALAGIGIPFTNWNLAELFDVPSARARHLGLLDDYGVPLDRESIGYGALAANEPHTPGAPFGNTGWTPDMNPTTSQYPSGYFPNEAALTIAANPEVFSSQPVTASPLARDVERTIAANPEVFGSPVDNVRDASREPGGVNYGGGVWNDLFGGAGNFGGQATTDVFGNTAVDVAPGTTEGWGGWGFAKGGKVPPPGRFAAGGAVAPPAANITPAQFGLLRGIDPPGPDDQIGALQTGEGVITKKAMGKGWGGLLAPINAGKIDPAKVKGLLAAKPRRPR